MPSSLSLQRVKSDADRRAFLQLPSRIYRHDPNWIPRLWPDQMAWLRREHGFFDHGDGEWFVARRDGELVGTIGVGIDHHVNQHQQRRSGVFGFLEFIEDHEVFLSLIEAARGWLWARGVTHMVGPQSFGPSDYPGFLVGRYDIPPALFEGHTPPYYLAFAERAGWSRNIDSLAYRAFRQQVGDHAEFMPEKILVALERIGRNPRYGIRQADLTQFEREFQIVLRLYNRSLATLRDFAPVAEDEFRRFVHELTPVLHEDLVLFALADGKEVGFSLALPNLAEAFRACGGLRYPWQIVGLWWGRRRIRGVSYKILAMDPDYWGLGIEALMFARMIENCLRRGYEWMDLSLTGEDNPQTNKLATRMGAEEYKRYRTFTIPVA
jgi:GNAT superfamily N-acetyltransferase